MRNVCYVSRLAKAQPQAVTGFANVKTKEELARQVQQTPKQKSDVREHDQTTIAIIGLIKYQIKQIITRAGYSQIG